MDTVDIFGQVLLMKELIGMIVGGVVGAAIIAYTLYVVAKVRHDSEILDEANENALMGEKMDSWRIEKSGAWYKGYKLALVACFLLSAVVSALITMLVAQASSIEGAIEYAAVAFVGAIIGGMLLDKKVIHPIADNRFLEEVETPLIEAFLQPAEAPAADQEDVEALIEKLKAAGIIQTGDDMVKQ